MGVINNTRVKDDSAMGLVLSVFFGFGLMLLTFVQRMPDAIQAGLDKFLFGQAAARQWANRMHVMVILSALFGALAGVAGTVISGTTTGLSTGPTIVLSISVIVLFSLLSAPNRGLIWRWLQAWRNRRTLQLEAVLLDLYTLATKHGDRTRGHLAAILRTMRTGVMGVERSLRELESRGWVCCGQTDEWTLTEAGWGEAERLASARLTAGHGGGQ